MRSDTRAALYLDFDNVFSGLLALDPGAAVDFAERPYDWLTRLRSRFLVAGTRTWLVRRCYMNPAGSVIDPREDANGRLYFSRYRLNFVRSGFDVVDCPALSHRAKNAADIRMALDAYEAMTEGPARYDEFVIASGDSDLTPLLVRLRAADRRTTILSPSDASIAYTSVADLVIDGLQALDLVRGEAAEPEETTTASAASVAGAIGAVAPELMAAHQEFRTLVTSAYDDATEALNLAALSQQVHAELGDVAKDSDWFGLGGFAAAIELLDLPNARRVSGHLYDPTRHTPPAPGAAATVDLPAPVERVCLLLDVPRLEQDDWRRACDVLARFAATHDYNLTEATKWSRDTLAENGASVPRNKLGFIIRGAIRGGAPLYADPPPTGEDVARAFVANTLDRADHAGIELDEDERGVITDWIAGAWAGA